MLYLRIFALARIVAKTLALYVLLCLILPPLVGKPAAAEAPAFAGEAFPERVMSIDDNAKALLWRLRLIELAQDEIILSTHDLRPDGGGTDVMSALLCAAERGVKVKLLVDGFNGGVPLKSRAVFRALASSPHVEVRFYNTPKLWTLWRINYRMHDKYLIADDFAYLLGGRNTNDRFLGEFTDFRSTDREVLVYETDRDAASSLREVKAYFDRIWDAPCNEEFTVRRETKAVVSAGKALRERYEQLAVQYDVFVTAEDLEVLTVSAENITLLSNPIAAGNKEPALWNDLCARMAVSEEVLIQTPYIILDQAMYRTVAELVEGGTQVHFLTNAVTNGANLFGCSDYLNEKNHILRTGAQVYEYTGDHSLHTKAILLDDLSCVIGSFNMDRRSARLDTELMLVIDSPELAVQLAEELDTAIEHSRYVLSDGSQTTGQDYAAGHLGVGKTILYTLLRILTPPFRYLL